MKILLTNDDGIHAPGILALHDALIDSAGAFGGTIGETILPVAPLTVQSASSHGITYKSPLMISEEIVSETMTGIAVEGRPADCVKLAIESIWPERFGADARPDLVISGLNSGANVGVNVIYSGTVAAALEAAFLGVPSIAVSLHIGPGATRYDIGACWARHAIELVLGRSGRLGKDSPFGPHSCVSINIPRSDARSEDGSATLESHPAPPMIVCPMNTHPINDAYEKRASPQGHTYYWASGGGLDFTGADPDTDVDHLFRGLITLTPLKYDLTHHDRLTGWRRLVGQ